MDGLFDAETYLPDRPPTWSDVVIVISGSMTIGIWLQSLQPSSLLAVAFGFVGAVILFGPVAQTRAGKQINKWGTEIGSLGRATVIAVFAIAVTVAFSFEATPTARVRDIGLGLLLFAVLALAVNLVHERRIKSWLPETS